MLTLDVVGPSQQIVRERQAALIRRVQQELYQLQREAGVPPTNDITATPAPQSSVIYYIQGNRPRALGMTALMGLGVTISVVLAVDRRRRHREGAPPKVQAGSAVVVP